MLVGCEQRGVVVGALVPGRVDVALDLEAADGADDVGLRHRSRRPRCCRCSPRRRGRSRDRRGLTRPWRPVSGREPGPHLPCGVARNNGSSACWTGSGETFCSVGVGCALADAPANAIAMITPAKPLSLLLTRAILPTSRIAGAGPTPGGRRGRPCALAFLLQLGEDAVEVVRLDLHPLRDLRCGHARVGADHVHGLIGARPAAPTARAGAWRRVLGSAAGGPGPRRLAVAGQALERARELGAFGVELLDPLADQECGFVNGGSVGDISYKPLSNSHRVTQSSYVKLG